MYEYLCGRLTSKTLSEAVIDVQGVGFLTEISLRTAERLPSLGSSVQVYVHFRPMEDRARLFGFIDQEERTLFREVQTVAGIGPSIALALLAGHEPNELWRLLRDGEWKALSKTKGIGPKIAQRACAELKEKARRHALGAGAAAGSPQPTRTTDAIEALLVLGYTDQQAEKAILLASKALPEDAPVEALVREALKHT